MLTFANAASVTTSRNRFQELKWFLHIADYQNLSAGDKMSNKVSPLYQPLNDRLLQCGIFHWLSALMNLWSHTMVGAARRFS
ncbi:hypothetical protein T01_14337 [Trichinella spiralis]|uniref:Uncharacterized protein n=1 Tax=Trichinella spiralis TaxID=6334 RepID=A0A0V1APB8_TRISP|nr:hypothetical protein T01_14337 [Trichinella spiralis]